MISVSAKVDIKYGLDISDQMRILIGYVKIDTVKDKLN